MKKGESSIFECVFCFLKGGVLKLVVEIDSKEIVGRIGMKFVYLFCS